VSQPAKLEQYRKLIDEEIADYSKRLITKIGRTYGRYSRESTEAFIAILGRGGKRLRGALVISAYEMLGGKDQAVAIKVARVVEMVHAYLLITDDIADRSSIRRGGPSAHQQMSDYHAHHHLKGDGAHFGTSIAMMAALANAYQAELDLAELPVSDNTKLRILKSLQLNLVYTLYGQLQDIFIEAVKAPREADALRVVKLKTAYYTFVNPLEIGAILAGAGAEDIRALKLYGLKAGVAFQLADDILGVFAEAEQSGKSPLDDIKEGKATLLIVRALDKGTSAQKRLLRHCLGNPELTEDDLIKCRDIIVGTGALEYTKQVAASYAQKALGQLDGAPQGWKAEQKDFLRSLTHYVVERRI
jgi:geranylgeranyl pyrophosphate synthase